MEAHVETVHKYVMLMMFMESAQTKLILDE